MQTLRPVSWWHCVAKTTRSASATASDVEPAEVVWCAGCPHAADLLSQGKCRPADACVRSPVGRQIDRFFRANPGIADAYADTSHWERRAIALRYASMSSVRAHLRDDDEVVRRVVAGRLPPAELHGLRRDSDREVRIAVAQRLPVDDLLAMAGDADYLVRVVVARRLAHGRLPRLVNDPEREVRKTVARRLPAFALGKLVTDPEPEVRRIVAERALPQDAARLVDDPEWTVRLAACAVAPKEAVRALLADPEPEVRKLACERLAKSDSDEGG